MHLLKKPWFIILLIIFFPLIPIILLLIMWKYSNFKTTTKLIITCAVAAVIAAVSTHGNKNVSMNKSERPAIVSQQLVHIYDNPQILTVRNKEKTFGKQSVIKIRSSELSIERLEDWYFNYAKPNVDNGNLRSAVIVYTDIKNKGIIYNGTLHKDSKLEKNQFDSWSFGGGTLLTEDNNNPGHLVK